MVTRIRAVRIFSAVSTMAVRGRGAQRWRYYEVVRFLKAVRFVETTCMAFIK